MMYLVNSLGWSLMFLLVGIGAGLIACELWGAGHRARQHHPTTRRKP